MILGARAVPGKARGTTDARRRRIARLRARRHANVVAVALAGKNARIVWPVLVRDEECDPARVAAVKQSKQRGRSRRPLPQRTCGNLAGDGEKVAPIAFRT
ncbi:hypothetical protein [Mangrovicoccus sp. HB161399]|uniref:hypothetical protein n=1 Tax=Mangrovicoccus sp. HB161399 TaxID=2720392 RepID=UPI001552711C|nr:hypothetical protein [Mangrovicoccus sp. HB161399]